MSLLLVIILKALTEIAIFAFLGQGILYLFAGAKRETNFVYATFKLLTSPMTKLTRLITLRCVADQYISTLTFFLLLSLWVALTITKINLVLSR